MSPDRDKPDDGFFGVPKAAVERDHVLDNARAALYTQITRLRRVWRVSGLRFEAFCIARSLPGVKVRETRFSTPAFRGILVTAPDKSKAIIVLNSLRSEEEQTFDLTHELVHFELHPPTMDSQKYSQFYEWQANEGAAELLMPRATVLEDMYVCRKEIRDPKNQRGYISARADHFGVTQALFERRLFVLRYDIRQALSGIPPEEIPILPQSWYSKINNCQP